MSFQDLPNGWQSMSLSDPALAVDVVDLFLGYFDRQQHSALLILCDESGCAEQPVVVNGIDWHMPAAERPKLFRFLEGMDVPKVVVAVSAPTPIPSPTTQRWRRTAETVLAEVAVELMGFYCADTVRVWDAAPQAA